MLGCSALVLAHSVRGQLPANSYAGTKEVNYLCVFFGLRRCSRSCAAQTDSPDMLLTCKQWIVRMPLRRQRLPRRPAPAERQEGYGAQKIGGFPTGSAADGLTIRLRGLHTGQCIAHKQHGLHHHAQQKCPFAIHVDSWRSSALLCDEVGLCRA